MEASGRIAVVGATGRAGHHVVDVLEEGGHDVVKISRSSGVDVITGEGLADALHGVERVIDASASPSPDQAGATEFFTTAAGNLQAAGERAGVQRIVVISVIGCDRFTAGYNAAKTAHEQAAQAGPVPVSVLRAAQFHEFVPLLVEWGTQGDVSFVPMWRMQPAAARTVAEALAGLATGEPGSGGGAITEVAGPREEDLVELAKLFVARRGDPMRIEGGGDPDDPDRELAESGGLLPGPNATLAGPTFLEWLEATY